jgi:integrase/recombinase XerD
MANVYKKPIVVIDPKSGHKIKTKSRKWWGRYRDANEAERPVPLAADKIAAQAMLNEIIRKVEREKARLVDPTEEQRKRALTEHLTDFKRYLQNKGVTLKQKNESTKQVEKMINVRKWKLIGDISAGGALEFLGEQNGKSAQTYNHYLKAAKQFTRWLVRDRRSFVDPLAHLSKLNVRIDRRHDRRALTTEEFTRLVEAAEHGHVIETISGPDRAMMYILAGWTGFRKGEIGSLTLRSFQLDDDPPTAAVAACYSKRKRSDTQILHPEVVGRLKQWLLTKPGLEPDELLFPISGRVPGGKERKTHKMMQLDLETARTKWIEKAETPEEKQQRVKTDFLAYRSEDGLFADFHSNRHLFITSLERAGMSPKMAQTLARHSDIRLTLGVYTHVGLRDQLIAIESLPAPPGFGDLDEDAAALRATGTDGLKRQARQKAQQREVPTMVPRGAEIGAVVLASEELQVAPNCTDRADKRAENVEPRIAATPNTTRTFRTQRDRSTSNCTDGNRGRKQLSPAGLEPATFGFGVGNGPR